MVQRFEALDGMRGVAALTVVLLHYGFVTGVELAPAAVLSVDLFFVLSGFVIALSYEQRLRGGLGFGRFMRARARRLLPTHFYALCAAASATIVAFEAHNTGAGITLPVILFAAALNALFIPDRIFGDIMHSGSMGPAFGINFILWSLWDEWIVNIIYASATFTARTRTTVALWAISVSFAIWFAIRIHGWQFGSEYPNLILGVFRALAGFTAGVLVYRAYVVDWIKRIPVVSPWLIYSAWAFICVSSAVRNHIFTESLVAIVIAPLCIACLVRSERPVGSIFRWLGSVSYPLYASHLAVLILAGTAARNFGLKPSPLYFAPLVAIALALAELVRRLSEMKFRTALQRA